MNYSEQFLCSFELRDKGLCSKVSSPPPPNKEKEVFLEKTSMEDRKSKQATNQKFWHRPGDAINLIYFGLCWVWHNP